MSLCSIALPKRWQTATLKCTYHPITGPNAFPGLLIIDAKSCGWLTFSVDWINQVLLSHMTKWTMGKPYKHICTQWQLSNKQMINSIRQLQIWTKYEDITRMMIKNWDKIRCKKILLTVYQIDVFPRRKLPCLRFVCKFNAVPPIQMP